jgi:hypothetical protein
VSELVELGDDSLWDDETGVELDLRHCGAPIKLTLALIRRPNGKAQPPLRVATTVKMEPISFAQRSAAAGVGRLWRCHTDRYRKR